MFSGIVQDLGKVLLNELTSNGRRLVVDGAGLAPGAKIGDSIAVNGCCLTVVEISKTTYAFDLTPESLKLTNLGHLGVGSRVNLEKAMYLGSPINGHLVQGHVDAMAKVLSLEVASGESLNLTIEVPSYLKHYFIYKGSVTLDGVSLTIASLDNLKLLVALIPHTARVTNLGKVKTGDWVNIEVDLFAKYTKKILSPQLTSMEIHQ